MTQQNSLSILNCPIYYFNPPYGHKIQSWSTAKSWDPESAPTTTFIQYLDIHSNVLSSICMRKGWDICQDFGRNHKTDWTTLAYIYHWEVVYDPFHMSFMFEKPIPISSIASSNQSKRLEMSCQHFAMRYHFCSVSNCPSDASNHNMGMDDLLESLSILSFHCEIA